MCLKEGNKDGERTGGPVKDTPFVQLREEIGVTSPPSTTSLRGGVDREALISSLWWQEVREEGNGLKLCQGKFRLDIRKNFLSFLKFLKVLKGWSDTAAGCSGKWSGIEPTGIQETLGQCSQTEILIFGWSCLESGIGLNDPCVSLPIEDVILFYDSITDTIFLCVCLLPNNKRYVYLFCLLSHFSFALSLA